MNLKHVHIIGVCGTLMGAFAAFLTRAGVRVTGSDQNIYPPMSDILKNAGVELFLNYDAKNLDKIGGIPDQVVVGNVISQGNAEMSAFIARGDAYVSLPEFMERHLLENTRNLVVSGTHGKTTTASLLAHVLIRCERAPSYFIGGVSHTLPFSFHVEKGSKFFVLEGDEYDTAFWDKVPKFNHYLPNDVILTSVEFDHADIYADLKAVILAFSGLISRIRKGGSLIACIESQTVRDLILQSKVPVITYSRFEKDLPDYTFKNLSSSESGIEFDIFALTASKEFKKVERLSLKLPGEHNALNALAVYIECLKLGLSSEEIKRGLESFQGIKRRQEERGQVNQILVIDDFAHHPTAVRETLNALRAKYKGRRLVTVFEPRSATSRRKIFQKEYTEAFQDSDLTFIASAFDQSKIALDDQFSSLELVQGLQKIGKEAHFFDGVDLGVKEVARLAKPNDAIAVLSNGGFGGFIPKLLEELKSKCAMRL